MPKPSISVVTANAHEGRFVRSGGLAKFADSDVILLQETHPDRDDLEATLEKETDLRLVIGSSAMRMAIAVNKNLTPSNSTEIPVQTAGNIINDLRSTLKPENRFIRRFRDRGFLSTTIEFDREPLTLLTTHINVAVRPKKRQDHLEQIPEILDRTVGSLIMAGDMNHWPGPRPNDTQMQRSANLSRAQIDQPTWIHSQSGRKHQLLGGALEKVGLSMDAEMDAVFWRNDRSLQLESVAVEPIQSDHRAVVAVFSRS